MEKTITLSKDNDEEQLLIEQLSKVNFLKENADKVSKEYNEKKEIVYDMVEQYMKTKKAKCLIFDALHSDALSKRKLPKSFCASIVKRTTVSWFIDKLANVLTKVQNDKVISKRYEVTSWQSLVSVMKKYNVPPKEVLEFINVEKTINENALEQLHALGELDEHDIKDCFKTEVTSSYLQMRKVKDKD